MFGCFQEGVQMVPIPRWGIKRLVRDHSIAGHVMSMGDRSRQLLRNSGRWGNDRYINVEANFQFAELPDQEVKRGSS